MPYRLQEVREYCQRCDHVGEHVCVRCGLLYCPAHAPASDDVRCHACEHGYHNLVRICRGLLPERESGSVRGYIGMASFAAVLVAAGFGTSALALVASLAALALGAGLTVDAVMMVRRDWEGRLRRQFLAERGGLLLTTRDESASR